jgi:TPR repeat protein
MLGSDAMKSLWRLAAPITCVVLICAAGIAWHFVEARVTARKLAANAKACRARAEQGDTKAQFDLASMYYYGKGVPQDYGEAARWYRRGAEQRNVKAEDGLGYMYFQGLAVPQDYTEAANWYRKAADQGYAKAQYDLGNMYYQGNGLAQDYAAAVGWFRKAADQGDAWAEDALGFMNYWGKGVPQDYAQAAGWYRKAADQGYAKSQYALGYMYSQGTGVPHDNAEAVRWYRRAAKQGDEYARRALGSMKIAYNTQSKITLSLVFLGSIVLLIRPAGNIRNRQRRRTALAGLFGLSWVGLQVFGHSDYGLLLSLSAVNAFYFGKGLLSGICVAMFISIARLQGAKTSLRICGMLFIGLNIYAATHYQLRHLAPALRIFYSANALLIGIAIPSAIFLWLEGRKTEGDQNGDNGAVPGTVAGSGTEPLRM